MNCRSCGAVAAAALIALLVGCATSAQHQEKAMVENINAAVSQLKECLASVNQSEAYSPLRGKMPESWKETTLQQLTDASMLTDQQKTALFAVHPLFKACRQTALDQMSQTNPTITPIISDGMSTTEESLVDLVNRNQTWGTHNKRVKAAGELTERKLIAEGQRIGNQLNLSHQQELAQRHEAEQAVVRFAAAAGAIALLALQEQANERQLQLNSTGPVYTNCYTTGNLTNCTSH